MESRGGRQTRARDGPSWVDFRLMVAHLQVQHANPSTSNPPEEARRDQRHSLVADFRTSTKPSSRLEKFGGPPVAAGCWCVSQNAEKPPNRFAGRLPHSYIVLDGWTKRCSRRIFPRRHGDRMWPTTSTAASTLVSFQQKITQTMKKDIACVDRCWRLLDDSILDCCNRQIETAWSLLLGIKSRTGTSWILRAQLEESTYVVGAGDFRASRARPPVRLSFYRGNRLEIISAAAGGAGALPAFARARPFACARMPMESPIAQSWIFSFVHRFKSGRRPVGSWPLASGAINALCWRCPSLASILPIARSTDEFRRPDCPGARGSDIVSCRSSLRRTLWSWTVNPAKWGRTTHQITTGGRNQLPVSPPGERAESRREIPPQRPPLPDPPSLWEER